jgi:hypothetical protein
MTYESLHLLWFIKKTCLKSCFGSLVIIDSVAKRILSNTIGTDYRFMKWKNKTKLYRYKSIPYKTVTRKERIDRRGKIKKHSSTVIISTSTVITITLLSWDTIKVLRPRSQFLDVTHFSAEREEHTRTDWKCKKGKNNIALERERQ